MADQPEIPERFFDLLSKVKDPEIPILTVLDMGVVRKVEEIEGKVIVTITPTYSGCPAMDTIEKDIIHQLEYAGYDSPEVKTVLFPPWTTDWFSEEAKEKLIQTGISPPDKSLSKAEMLGKDVHARCPRCSSVNTTRISEFGSTACKALYKCHECGDPFDYFKCI